MQSELTEDGGIEQDLEPQLTSKPEDEHLNSSKKTKVVIVGAGLAGLAALQRLYEAGIEDVIVLEAQDRVGGRVHTIRHGSSILELGAQWLHGAEENPIFGWLDGMKLLSDYEDGAYGLQGRYLTSERGEIEGWLVQKFLNVMVDIKMSLFNQHITDPSNPGSYKSARQIFRQQFDLRIKSDADMSSREAHLNALFEWFLRYEAIENGCDSMTEVSIASYTDWTDFCDGALLNFRDGYETLLHWFCSQVSADKVIHLSQEVVNIEIMKANPFTPIRVRYRDTKTKSQTAIIECSHVIMTASIGFLKKHQDTMFIPPLPDRKRRLIKKLGFGTVNKIFLQFDKPFWNDPSGDSTGIKLVWKDQDQSIRYPNWVHDIISFEGVRRQPNILVGWIGGHGARLMEEDSDAVIGQVCLRILRQFLPRDHEKPSKLLNCFTTRWHSNSYTCGSYSFRSMRSNDEEVEGLHEPVFADRIELEPLTAPRIPRLLFAGEATAGKLYSTTHGAIITGWREADRLISIL